jgi:hypothetical protein
LAMALVTLALVAPIVAAPATGEAGATVGAIVGALLILGLAIAVWPYAWSGEELKHHELESIWREVRSDADRAVPWERYAAWAESNQASVELTRITCAPADDRLAGAPSPFSLQTVRRVAADDIAAAAEAMEELRAEAAELELRAQQRHAHEAEEAEREAQERVLRKIDQATTAELKAREEQLERELVQQEAAERKAQAEAVARALRRP